MRLPTERFQKKILLRFWKLGLCVYFLLKDGHCYDNNDCCIRFCAMWLQCNLYNTMCCMFRRIFIWIICTKIRISINIFSYLISHTIPEENSSEILETMFLRVLLVQEGHCYKRIIIIVFRIFCGLLAKKAILIVAMTVVKDLALYVASLQFIQHTVLYVQKKILLSYLQLYNYKNIHKCVFPFAFAFNPGRKFFWDLNNFDYCFTFSTFVLCSVLFMQFPISHFLSHRALCKY